MLSAPASEHRWTCLTVRPLNPATPRRHEPTARGLRCPEVGVVVRGASSASRVYTTPPESEDYPRVCRRRLPDLASLRSESTRGNRAADRPAVRRCGTHCTERSEGDGLSLRKTRLARVRRLRPSKHPTIPLPREQRI